MKSKKIELFVSKAIQILGATRATEKTKDPIYKIKYIPYKISKVFDFNEEGKNQKENEEKFRYQMRSYMYKLTKNRNENDILLLMLSESISAFDDHFSFQRAKFQFKKYLKFHSDFEAGLTERIKKIMEKYN